MDELEEKMVSPKHGDPPATNPTQCLAHLLVSKDMVDLTIIIPGHYDNYKVHRLVLGMWSEVFQAMLFGPMAEGDTITLEEDPPEAFNWLLNYMYAGQTEFESIELALQVYYLANKYLMRHLKSVCSKYLLNKVTAVSVPEILDIASLLEDEALIDKCTKVLYESADSFFSSPSIGLLNSDSLEQLLRKDFPVTSEAVIYQGIVNWGKAHLITKGKENNAITLRQEVEKFLPQIRFLSMSLEDFVNNVLPDTILTIQELQAIQLNIECVSEVMLPPFFSTIKVERAQFHTTKLKTCHIKNGKLISSGSNQKFTTTRANILDDIHSENIIYLSKLEYESNIGHVGTLTVNNLSGKELQVVVFDGQRAKFKEPLQLLPNERYTFTVMLLLYTFEYSKSYSIKPNGLISGHMRNYIDTPFDLHYWK